MNRAQWANHYGYINRPITPALTAHNGCHQDLYQKGVSQRVLINYLKPTDTFRSVSISDIVTDRGRMDRDISYASMHQLVDLGLQLPPDSFNRLSVPLITSYLLNSSLCYVESLTRDGRRKTYFTTKNYSVVNALADKLVLGENISKLKGYQAQLNTSVTEVYDGTFDAVILAPEVDGLKISKGKINSNNKTTFISTMYSVGNWNDSIIRYLARTKVKIFYWEDGEQKVLLTSLLPQMIASWLGTNNKAAVLKVIEETQDAYCLGNIILPDFNHRGEFVTVPIINISSIQPVK